MHLELHCANLEEATFRRVLQAELGGELVNWKGSGVTAVEVSCEETTAQLQVQDPVTRKSVRRSLDLDTVPPGSRERLVALASAELVVASWAELELTPAPSVEPTGPRPPPEAVSAAQQVVRAEIETAKQSSRRYQRHGRTFEGRASHRFAPVVSVRGFTDERGSLWGGGVRYGAELKRIFSGAADTLIESGHIGDADVVTSTIGGHLGFSHQGRFGAVRVGAGLRVGMVHAELIGADHEVSRSTVAPWGWPMMVGSFNIWASKSVHIEGAVEGGYVVLPIPGGSNRSGHSAVEGIWLSGQLGIGWRW